LVTIKRCLLSRSASPIPLVFQLSHSSKPTIIELPTSDSIYERSLFEERSYWTLENDSHIPPNFLVGVVHVQQQPSRESETTPSLVHYYSAYLY
jgi:hypothetical protein